MTQGSAQAGNRESKTELDLQWWKSPRVECKDLYSRKVIQLKPFSYFGIITQTDADTDRHRQAQTQTDRIHTNM